MAVNRPFAATLSMGLAAAVLLCFIFSNVSLAKEHGDVIPDKSGPIPVVNQSPIQLLFLQPVPDRAVALKKGTGSVGLTTTLTNTLVSQQSLHFDATLDLETVRTCLDVRYGFGNELEIGFFLPYYYFFDGILDHIIEDIESASGSVRGVREAEDKNSFAYSVTKDGKAMITGYKNTSGFGDAVISIKKTVMKQQGFWPSCGVRGTVKIPTGSKGKGFGNGEWDASLGLLLEDAFGRFNLYGNADIIFPGDAFEDEGVSLQEFVSLMFGVEYGFTPNFSAIGQFHYYSRPFENTGVAPLDRRIFDILLGVNYRFHHGLFIQGGFVEDIIDSADATSDVSLFFNVGKHF